MGVQVRVGVGQLTWSKLEWLNLKFTSKTFSVHLGVRAHIWDR